MAKYTVTIEEMVSQDFEVEANCAEEKYNSGEFVLEPGDLVAKQIAITSPDSEATEWTEL